ncbi:MAG: endonuclease domain-containing protein [Actinomycetota bacterium]
MHVDHHHATGEVRGILCFNCIKALGHFEEDVQVMQAAIDYMEGRPA